MHLIPSLRREEATSATRKASVEERRATDGEPAAQQTGRILGHRTGFRGSQRNLGRPEGSCLCCRDEWLHPGPGHHWWCQHFTSQRYFFTASFYRMYRATAMQTRNLSRAPFKVEASLVGWLLMLGKRLREIWVRKRTDTKQRKRINGPSPACQRATCQNAVRRRGQIKAIHF